jgi:hypothetical protein
MGLGFARARFAAPAAVVGLCFAACGTSQPPLLTSEFEGATLDSGLLPEGAPPSLLEDTGIPSCEAGLQGDVCGCLDLDLLSPPPNIYFVLDRSGSMNDSNKWTTIRNVIAQIMADLGPRAVFGAAVFPDPTQDLCSVGTQVMPLMLGDAPAGTYGVTVSLFTQATDVGASGGTPTAATLTALTPILAGLSGKTFVILATDGGPNCDSAITCDASACTSNIEGSCPFDAGVNCCTGDPEDCLDTQATVTAVNTLAQAGVPTYVVGVPGSGPYTGVLDQMALAGGTARSTAPYYYAVSTSDQAAFASTLSTVAAQVTATCTLVLSAPPPDPTRVNVYLDGTVVPADPVNGWTLSGSTVTLEGTTCAEVLSGAALSLRIVAGCPTVLAISRKPPVVAL